MEFLAWALAVLIAIASLGLVIAGLMLLFGHLAWRFLRWMAKRSLSR